MKLSEKFNLRKTQYELDFVDIDLTKDTPLFIDPYFLAQRNDQWSIDANRSIRSFFQHIINLIRANSIDQGRELFVHLGEPNETCLGLSKGAPQGRGVGSGDASKIFNSLLQSTAVRTGIVEDIEDCRVLVAGVDKDKISDMATNVIRKHLMEYTQKQCELWEIPLQNNVPSGFFWDRHEREWKNNYSKMLIVDEKKILLTPKGIVSFVKDYTAQQYKQHFVLNFLQNEHLRMNSVLVQRRISRNGRERVFVTKKSISEYEEPMDKEYLARFTQSHPEIFDKFKSEVKKNLSSVKNSEITEDSLSDIIDFLISELRNTPTGTTNATKYHKLIVGILELIFYPNLTSPQVERQIDQGRKRIDITFDNAASSGFFHRLHSVNEIPSQFIFVECKNYTGDVTNPELDQLSGRFSLHSGKMGMLLCRKIEDFDTFIQRCRDTYIAGRGVVIPIVDSDLINILENIKNRNEETEEQLLSDRFRDIALS
ncbi:MAG: hypothetical protein COA36_11385 [Desulfotalea sp.]|nr:MAG: hypothetical protein COA36_11385 [Desulfotalea sp.]